MKIMDYRFNRFLFPRNIYKILDNTGYKVVEGAREQPQGLNKLLHPKLLVGMV